MLTKFSRTVIIIFHRKFLGYKINPNEGGNMHRKIILFLSLIILAAATYPLSAGELKGVKMDDSLTVEGNNLVLNGMALRKKFVLKVYVAGLYLPAKESNAEKILTSDEPRLLVMHFVTSVGAKKINGAWMEGLEDNTPNASADLKKRFDTLCAYMDKVKDGEQIVFSYIPGKGTVIKVKGTEKGVIEGKDFADALFACWIGPEPGPGEGFKKNLLGID
jgi:hypothetical protein